MPAKGRRRPNRLTTPSTRIAVPGLVASAADIDVVAANKIAF
jgi:hypothetical protein